MAGKFWLTRFKRGGWWLAALVLACGAASAWVFSAQAQVRGPMPAPVHQPGAVERGLQSGVLVVVSKPSQRMEVFNDGRPCLESAVSTGRRGHGTPAGIFPILEKRRFHRSNKYSNAPMPYMQRLTQGGIALHAGYVPGYPASHGCIRLPYAAARTLFGLTRAGNSTVVVVNAPMQSPDQARQLALAAQAGQTPVVRLATAPVTPPAPRPVITPVPGGQTIQLAAAETAAEAEAHWTRLLGAHADLGRYDKAVIPVAVGTRRFFRLRASGPGAHDMCARLRGAGVDCFNVL
jgi:hypothetical protein